MLEGRELQQPPRDALVGRPRLEGERGGSQGVLRVVGPLDAHVVEAAQDVVAPAQAHDETPVLVEPGAVRRAAGRLLAEDRDAPSREAQPLCHGAARLVGAQRAQAVGPHVRKDALLVRRVGLERAMPLDVVGRHVEHGRGARREPARAMQLEARQLGDEHLAGGAPGDACDGRQSDVAHRAGLQPRGAQQLAGERGGRGLAVGPRDGEPVARALAPRELRLAHQLGAAAGRRRVERADGGDAGAHHAQVEVALGLLDVPDDPDPAPLERLGGRTRGRGRGPGVHRDRAHLARGQSGEVLGRRAGRGAQTEQRHVAKTMRHARTSLSRSARGVGRGAYGKAGRRPAKAVRRRQAADARGIIRTGRTGRNRPRPAPPPRARSG